MSYDLHESNADGLVSTCIALLVTSWLAVGLRTYTRVFLMKSYQADDILMLIAQAIFTVTCSFTFVGVNRGIGRHDAAVENDDDRVAAIMWQALVVASYILNMMFVKLSIGVFLLRIATKKLYIWIIRTVLVIISLFSVSLSIWNLFQCTPVQKQWDYRITEGHCSGVDEILTAAYTLSVMTVVTDWIFALIPIPMLWGVKMSIQAKVTLCLVLSLGIFASIATLVRFRFLALIEATNDILFSPTQASIWSIVEVGVAITASSLATVRPLFRSLNIRGFGPTDKNTPAVDLSSQVHCLSTRRNAAGLTLPDRPGAYDIVLGSTPREEYDRSGKSVGVSIEEYHSSLKHMGGQTCRSRPDSETESELCVLPRINPARTPESERRLAVW